MKLTLLILLAFPLWPQNLGPIRDLRIPVYDVSCEARLGYPTTLCYRWLRFAEGTKIEPDTLGISSGIIWPASLVAAPGTNPDANTVQILPGSGLEIRTPFPGEGVPVRLQVDTSYIVHLAGSGSENEPQDGASCYNGPGLWLGKSAVYICAPPDPPRADDSGWTWIKFNRSGP